MNNLKNNYEDDNSVIYGRISVLELLKSGKPVDKILIGNGENKGSILKIISIAKEKGIPVKEVSKTKLDFICPNLNHQGIIAFVAAYKYSELDDIFNFAKQKNEKPFIVILDEIQDPHNMGAIIRTAEAAGAHGIIIPKRRNVGLTSIVMKTSAGACEHIPVVRVPNLVNAINFLKENDVWVYCLENDGENWVTLNYTGSIAIVVGSEGNGVSRLIKENSDFVVSLPMYGKINSLNASVAAGIFMYEVVRQRFDI